MQYKTFFLFFFLAILGYPPLCLANDSTSNCFVELEIRYLDTKADNIIGASFKQQTPPNCQDKHCCIDIAKPADASAKHLTIWNTKSIRTGNCRCWFYRKHGCPGQPVLKTEPNHVEEDYMEMLKTQPHYIC
ncbi:hypothetical protein TWF281_007537 [Arthrobotrys megalospora]